MFEWASFIISLQKSKYYKRKKEILSGDIVHTLNIKNIYTFVFKVYKNGVYFDYYVNKGIYGELRYGVNFCQYLLEVGKESTDLTLLNINLLSSIQPFTMNELAGNFDWIDDD